MSTVVDERIVAMEFDNSKFESNVKTSMNTLDRLKKALRLDGAGKAAKSEFESYKAGVFSLTDAVNKAWASLEHDAAIRIKNIGKMFTIEPIKTGLQEYETQLNAVQTILANTSSKGTTLDDVNAALDTLNEYADKTIYNFTEMTRNIGTFTAAGVELDTATESIKGIANLAAMSGSTSQQASTAMYQLSQAISSGTVRLMDWNSVVNAGMGGEVFQNALKETAKEHGVAIDSIIKKQGSFRESLSEGWLTADILTETLAKFTDETTELGKTATEAATKVKTFTQLVDTLKESAQSGWSQSWRLIIGDFEQAKEMWTKVSEELGGVIGNSADKRNKILGEALNSGWNKFLDEGSIFNESAYLNKVTEFAKQYKVDLTNMKGENGEVLSTTEALRKALKEETLTSDVLAKSLNDLALGADKLSDAQLKEAGYTREQVDALIEFNRQIQNGEKSIEDFKDSIVKTSGRELLIESFANLYNTIKNIVSPIAKAWEQIFPSEENGEKLYKVLEAFRDFTNGLKEFTSKNADKLQRTFAGLFAVIDIIGSVLKFLIKVIGALLKPFGFLASGVLTVTAYIGDFLVMIRDTIKGTKGLEVAADGITYAMEKVTDVFKNFTKAVNGKIKAPGLEKFVNFLKSIWNLVKTVFTAIINAVASLGKNVFTAFDGSGIEVLLEIFNSGLLLSVFLGIKNLFSHVKDLTKGLSEILDSVADAFKSFQLKIKAEALKTTAEAIAILAVAIIAISLVNKEKLEESLAALSIIGLLLAGIMSTMTHIKTVGIAFETVVGVATAILLLSAALSVLAKIPQENIVPALTGMIGAMAALTLMMQALSHFAKVSNIGDLENKSFYVGLRRSIKQIIAISFAMIPLAIAMKLLGSMSWDEIAKGAAVMGTGLVAMLGTLALIEVINKWSGKNSSNNSIMIVIGKTLQFTMLTWAMGLLAAEAMVLALFDWAKILKGLAASFGVLSVLTVGLKLINKIQRLDPKTLLLTTASLAILAASMGMLGTQLMILGQLKWGTIAKGLTAMLGTMMILMSTIGLLQALSVSKFSLTEFLTSFVKGKKGKNGSVKSAIKDSTSIETSLIKTATSLLILAVAINVLAGSIVVLGQLKWGTIGKGLTVLAGAMLILVGVTSILNKAGGATGIIKFAAAIGILGLSCFAVAAGISFVIWSLAALGDTLSTSIQTICQALIDNADLIGEALGALLGSAIKALTGMADSLVANLAQLIVSIIKSLATYIPDMVGAFVELFVGVVDKVIEYLPTIMETLGKLINAVFSEALKVFGEMGKEAFLNGALALAAFGAFVVMLTYIARHARQAIGGLVVLAGVVTGLMVLLTLFSAFDTDDFDYMAETAKGFGNVIGQFIGGLISGLTVATAATIDTAIENLKKFADPQVITSLGAFAGVAAIVSKFGGGSLKNVMAGVAGFSAIALAITGMVALLGLGRDTIGNNGEVSPGLFKRGIERLKLLGSGEVVVALSAMAGLTVLFSKLGLEKFKSVNGTKGIVGGTNGLKAFSTNLLEFAEVVGAIMLMLGIIGLFNFAESTIQNGAKLIGVLGSPSVLLGLAGATALMFALSKISNLVKDIKNTKILMVLGELGIIITGVGALCALASLIPNQTMIDGTKNMLLISGASAGLLAVAGLTAVLNLLGKVIKGASLTGILYAIAAVEIVLLALTATIAAYAALTKIPGFTDFLRGGVEVFTILGEAIGGFVGGIVGGIAAGTMYAVASELPHFGKKLSEFMKELNCEGGFIKTLEKVDDSTLSAANNLANAILKLTSSELMDGLNKALFGSSFGAIGNTSKFADNAKQLGEGVKAFSDATKDITDTSGVEKGAEAAKYIANALDKMPKVGGIMQTWGGRLDFSNLKENITGFGKGVVAFANTIAGNKFIKGLDTAQVEKGCSAATLIAEALNKLPKNVKIFMGIWASSDIQWDKLESNFAEFATAIVTFGNKVSPLQGLNQNKIDTISAIVDAINKLDLNNGLATEGEIGSTMASNMENIALGISSFIENLSDIDAGQIYNVATEITQLVDSIVYLAEVTLGTLSNSLKTIPLYETIKGILDECSTLIGDEKLLMELAAALIMDTFKTQIQTATTEIKTAVTDMVTTIHEQVGGMTMYDLFRTAGSYAAEGFAAGIYETSYMAKDAAQRMCNEVTAIIESTMLIKSPSKRTKKLGAYTGEGYTLGLLDYVGKAKTAGADIADAAATGLQDSIYRISDIINSIVEYGLDSSPTITPVLDLNQVSNGMGMLNSMFGVGSSINIGASVNATMKKNQNDDNELLKEIRDLNNTLKNKEFNNYAIDGITYSDQDVEISNAIQTLIRATKIEGRR